LINECVTDLIETTEKTLRALRLESLSDVFSLPRDKGPVSNSGPMKERLGAMQKFLHAKLYRHPSVLRMSRRGERIIENLFHVYAERPQMMPDHFFERVESSGVHRVVSDYVSGMTDRFAEQDSAYISGGR